ncbi:Putative glycosyltransferase [uncultured Gammaproteobacteria bacterium]|nr:Putative glycosyltransferase [uncultured Gammaproteobacteria bacterium]CAC9562608.1 Putative glycosyltransferase [uncultured Gammaproteobacteria bacterium]CAC9563620.1 Putative glycosyltransferase [uncultured Gammaproteobacteria bacterium]CAC9564735.1 Putative glycosyltransferase [uncultured Gammaproteobacteria bacterium]CAC9575083.1 Putative glycosyltransferase [uncultured Gammaproteobacteria bacterium]
MMKFSVLMSIYHKESPQNFDRAMHSIWDEQTIKPNEIILVEDGQLTDGLYQVISHWQDKLDNIFKVTSLEKNVGTGNAKNIGVEQCTSELIAVMDTDDISLPDRFKKQLAVFETKGIDVCGTWVGEFEGDEAQIISYRRTPEQHSEIVAFAKSRSPVNHPTAMYKRKLVLNIGNYAKHRRTSQDYNLFVRLILGGAKLYNIQEPLVNMRMDSEWLESRRSGLKQAILEKNVQKEFYKMGFLNLYELFRNVVVGFIIRLLPKTLLKIVFKMIRKL